MTTPPSQTGVEHTPIVERLRTPLTDEAADLFAELVDALEELAEREETYRRCHDLYGSSDARTGRAWDLMRRAGDRARTLDRKARGEAL